MSGIYIGLSDVYRKWSVQAGFEQCKHTYLSGASLIEPVTQLFELIIHYCTYLCVCFNTISYTQYHKEDSESYISLLGKC